MTFQTSAFHSVKLKLGGAALALSLGLVACSNNTTTTPTPTGTYILTVNYTGIKGAHPVTVTDSAGNAKSYTLASGGGVSGLKGIYTVKGSDVGTQAAPAAQTVDLTSANQSITLAY